ncbi:hypothetical protein CSSP291_03070 [Cronobacter sakazakii SP291]|nr:hypothetical protein CSSP291_03070 [Cronobacter sakazakii SP291]ALB49554.1 hypothetical protein AFK64_02890 [Cronobacter sakazakii]
MFADPALSVHQLGRWNMNKTAPTRSFTNRKFLINFKILNPIYCSTEHETAKPLIFNGSTFGQMFETQNRGEGVFRVNKKLTLGDSLIEQGY